MMNRRGWYALMILRVGGGIGVAVLLLWAIYALPLPGWLKILLDIAIVGGVVAALAAGPWSYRQYQGNYRRVERALEEKGRD